jgi:hypothetical protein
MDRVKIRVALYVETEDAEEACMQLNSGLRPQLSHFPHGEIVGVEVENWVHATPDEQERYFEE